MRAFRFVFLGVVLLVLLVLPPSQSSAQSSSISLQIQNPVCVQSSLDSGTCYIRMRSVSVVGSGSSFSRLQVFINGKLRANMGGFFENSGYVVGNMFGSGFLVSCGGKNAGGNPVFGQSYTIQVVASLADSTTTTGSMAVFCPYYEGKSFLPLLLR
ncbi:hypothetical protein [Anaerolinea sp.]|uniref:hypothetical protein n=1 Tax=Anaerolinea sp. TaxID=1872519 RepID=UPI002ACEE1AF|nr:hypothetical protein [Anaerolinea sp.]